MLILKYDIYFYFKMKSLIFFMKFTLDSLCMFFLDLFLKLLLLFLTFLFIKQYLLMWFNVQFLSLIRVYLRTFI